LSLSLKFLKEHTTYTLFITSLTLNLFSHIL